MNTKTAAVRLLLIDAIRELHNWELGFYNLRAHEYLSEAIRCLEVGNDVKALYNIERALTREPNPTARALMLRAANRLAQ